MTDISLICPTCEKFKIGQKGVKTKCNFCEIILQEDASCTTDESEELENARI